MYLIRKVNISPFLANIESNVCTRKHCINLISQIARLFIIVTQISKANYYYLCNYALLPIRHMSLLFKF